MNVVFRAALSRSSFLSESRFLYKRLYQYFLVLESIDLSMPNERVKGGSPIGYNRATRVLSQVAFVPVFYDEERKHVG
jgi:hypothetical protein